MILIGLICLIAGAYQVVAILACLKQLTRTEPWVVRRPGVSILKPVKGGDEQLYEAIRTHAELVYPDFEILFGVQDLSDSALPFLERLRAEYPAVAIQIIHATTRAPNSKVGVLEELAAAARHPVLVANDADISVPHDYLHRLVAALANEKVGLVTCLYRATADSFASTLEALGIATDFAPSALVAPFVGVREFGLGSTLAFRAEVLETAGGFRAVREYLADDYQIGKRIHALGLEVEMSRMVVSTHLSGGWKEVWAHQVRWARTIRLSRSGYFGLPVTNASFWALLALLAGMWWAAIPLLALRLLAGFIAGRLVLRDPITKSFWWMMPARDLLGMIIWIVGAFGSAVRWRVQLLKLDSEGRISPGR
ncbi:MAG: bacteriohopanetetrol glucosamine biosynthesis glycosyltransferase HpnI [Bryobacteraceae bacterium]|nr:bacteriohopanetetrol glucosamine biosynthesis glycosyltransferase HpnI [Bryobacteraceae bacterium]